MPFQTYSQTELKHKKPMRELLLDLLNSYGFENTAIRLGVNETTLWKWTKRTGIRRECRYVVSGETERAS